MNRETCKPRLLVIDAPGISEVLTGFLKVAGYEVDCAPTLEAGLARACEERPDLVLTDGCPGGPGGPQLCVLLRSVLGEVDVPVACLSGHAGEETGEGPWLCTRILRTVKLALSRTAPVAVP